MAIVVLAILAGVAESASIVGKFYLVARFARFVRITSRHPNEPTWEQIVERFALSMAVLIVADLWVLGLAVVLARMA